MTLRAIAKCATLLLVSQFVTADDTNKMINGKPMVEITVQDEMEKAQDFKSMRHRDKAFRDKHFYNRQVEYLYRENRALRKRIHRLELAMIQIQDAMYDLQQSEPIPIPMNYSCALQTRNRGTFLGQGNTKTEAKARARMACEQEGSPFWCEGVMECDE